MTYGSGLDATSPETEPDLIEAYGVGGEHGYVRSDDLRTPAPASPADAVHVMERGVPDREVPLYAVDGVTVIGTFVIAGTSDVIE